MQSSVNPSGALDRNFVGGAVMCSDQVNGQGGSVSHVEDALVVRLVLFQYPPAPSHLVCCAGPALPIRRHPIEEAVGLAGSDQGPTRARFGSCCAGDLCMPRLPRPSSAV